MSLLSVLSKNVNNSARVLNYRVCNFVTFKNNELGTCFPNMPKQKLFDEDSEDEVTFKTQNEYAKKYDTWREKEELHKLEQKYGDKALKSDASSSSDSEDESDTPPEVSEEMETQFLKTLALLKTKDPRIYDPNFKFFEENKSEEPEKEYKTNTLTFADSDDDDEDDGNIFTVEKKATEPNTLKDKPDKNTSISDDGKLKDFLTGKAEHIDNPVEQDLAPLKALWSDPNINEGEAFLRDYILNKKYLNEADVGETLDKVRDDDDLEADEKMVEEQGKFERAYNFRFEEPDQEYLKRFPRTMNYMRPKDDRRSRKRAEIKTRKEEEKKKKMEEIARMKALKLKELQEKIAKIKEVTGNDDLAFKEEDIEGEFDPEEHDRRMQQLFDDQYYGHTDTHKPVFPDLDQELEIENWDNYDPERENNEQEDDDEPHCEDQNFNMDADYDPKQSRTNLLEEIKRTLGKKRRNRKKKSALSELLCGPRPVFVPGTGRYGDHMDAYYGLECEDIIAGDIHTRFKYRQVVPNDYGLTVEEILLADDRELTQWVPLKKLVKYRPEHVEKGEINTYASKAADVNLKRKILPSLFNDLPEEPEIVVPLEKTTKKRKKKKKNKDKNKTENGTDETELTTKDEENEINIDNNSSSQIEAEEVTIDTEESNTKKEKRKKKKNKEQNENKEENETASENNSSQIETQEVVDNTDNSNSNKKEKRKKKKNKTQNGNKEDETEEKTEETVNNVATIENKSTKKKSKHKPNSFIVEETTDVHPTLVSNQNKKKRKMEDKNKTEPSAKKKKFQNKKEFKTKFNQNNKPDNSLENISDNRLKAYGLNPKKYKNFLKYKKF